MFEECSRQKIRKFVCKLIGDRGNMLDGHFKVYIWYLKQYSGNVNHRTKSTESLWKKIGDVRDLTRIGGILKVNIIYNTNIGLLNLFIFFNFVISSM